MGSHAARKDPFTVARGKLCKGEAGKTGDWRSSRPEIDLTKCIPSKSGKSACFLCWQYCPEGVVKKSIPVEIDMEFCKGCGICAEECPAKAITMVDEHKSE
ncbi:MAG: 4Fe-4S binding protein [Desulfobacteraceae bacterium]|nr:4Fe-4S binding protein [Desulfobacteraceae bacterium]